jgi:hypothetical protein
MELISFGKTLYLTRWFRSKSCKCAVLNIRTLMKYMYKFIWYGCKIIYLVLNNIHTLSEWFRQPDTVTVFTRNNISKKQLIFNGPLKHALCLHFYLAKRYHGFISRPKFFIDDIIFLIFQTSIFSHAFQALQNLMLESNVWREHVISGKYCDCIGLSKSLT